MSVRGQQLPRVIFLDPGKRRRRRRAFGFGTGVVVLAILVVAIAAGSFSSSTARSVVAEAGIRLGGAPLQATSGSGSVWVLTCERDCSGRRSAGQIVGVDDRSGEITHRIGVVDANAFAIGGGALWLTHFYDGTVSRIDLPTGHTTRTIKLALPRPVVAGDRRFVPNSISAGGDRVWVTTARGWVARIDARSGRVAAMLRAPLDVTGNAVTGPHGTWLAESGLGVGLVHPTSPRVRVRAIRSGRDGRFAVDQLAVGGGRVWLYGEVAVPAKNGVNQVLTNRARLMTLDERDGRLIHQQQFPDGPYTIAFGNHALFAANVRTGRLYRIDATYRVRALRPVRGPGTLIAVTPGAVWATTQSRLLLRIAVASQAPTIGSVPTPPAGAIVFDKAASDSLDARIEIAYVPARGGAVVSLPNAGKDGMIAAEPRWSADGSRIAFVMSPRGHLTRYAGDGDIYVMNADGSGIRRLTGRLDASSPAWSSDGSRIAFVRNQGQELVVMNADGADQRVIARARGYYEGPAWSPDGQAIAYQSSPGRDRQVTAIFTIRPDGTGERQLTRRSAPAGSPAWSPRGSRIAYAASDRLWVMSADGTNAHPVTHCRLPACVFDFAPAWSPNGSELVFVRQEDGGGARRLYALELATGAVRPVTPGVRWAGSPDWRR